MIKKFGEAENFFGVPKKGRQKILGAPKKFGGL